ncbi:isochorismatase [Azoarcus sp. DD4]|uniref:isochorismatase family protein n=1 Tax=Azoarcus sp. DD4 TaxID=2027405 RepID=UPI00112C6404|nr:isochorismatase family protein [Azoarcus sp. DD4]QDF98278.1 isochorismatase [Azoarcus sp. DD4]
MAIPKIASYPMPTRGWDNRVRWQPDARRAVLLVHDMQDYFLDFYDRGSAPVPTLIANVRRLIDLAHAQGIPVVYTAQLPVQTPTERGLLQDMWGPGLTAQPQRKDIVAELAPQAQDTVLDKWRYSAFQKSRLLELMRGQSRDQLIVCGVYAHIGCMASACEAFMNDIQPFFVADALADFSAQEHELALRYVAQRCGTTLLTAELADRLPPRLPASPAALRALVADSLQLAAAELGEDDNLLDWGLDSIRIMALVETWRRAGLALDFMTLAEQPTLAAWWALLERREAVACT